MQMYVLFIEMLVAKRKILKRNYILFGRIFTQNPLNVANSNSCKIDIPFEEKDKATIINMANKVTGLSKQTANTLAFHCFVFPISIRSEYTSREYNSVLSVCVKGT